MDELYRGVVVAEVEGFVLLNGISHPTRNKSHVPYFTKVYDKIGTARGRATVRRKELEKAGYRVVNIYTERVASWERID